MKNEKYKLVCSDMFFAKLTNKTFANKCNLYFSFFTFHFSFIYKLDIRLNSISYL